MPSLGYDSYLKCLYPYRPYNIKRQCVNGFNHYFQMKLVSRMTTLWRRWWLLAAIQEQTGNAEWFVWCINTIHTLPWNTTAWLLTRGRGKFVLWEKCKIVLLGYTAIISIMLIFPPKWKNSNSLFLPAGVCIYER